MVNRFLAYLVLFVAIISVGSLGVILLSDPTGLLRVSGFSSGGICQTGFSGEIYNIKPLAVYAIKPDVVVLGSSRVGLGMSASEVRNYTGGHKAYNMAAHGLDLEDLDSFVSISMQDNRPGWFFIGLDVHMFLASRSGKKDNRIIEMIMQDTPSLSRLLLTAHLDKNVVNDAVKRLVPLGSYNDACNDPDFYINGDYGDRFIVNNLELNGAQGQAMLVLQHKEQVYKKAALSFGNRESVFEEVEKRSVSFSKNLSSICESGARVRVFFNPVHAELQSLMEEVLPGAADRVKQQVVKVVDELKPGSCDIELWDFAVMHRYTTTRFSPGSSGEEALNMFWEPSHYKRQLGNIMLSVMNGENDEGFGSRLTASNIRRHLLEQGRLRARYQSSLRH